MWGGTASSDGVTVTLLSYLRPSFELIYPRHVHHLYDVPIDPVYFHAVTNI